MDTFESILRNRKGGQGMELSVFYAKLLGLYLLVVGSVWAFCTKQVGLACREILASRGMIVFSGLLCLFLGLVIVLSHPVWEINWRGLISLLGVLAIVQGIMRTGFSAQMQHFAQIYFKRLAKVVNIIVILLGIVLTYYGFLI